MLLEPKKLKTLALEQNNKVIAHLEKMLDVVEDDQVDAYITAQMEDAEGVEKQITEMFVCIVKESKKM